MSAKHPKGTSKADMALRASELSYRRLFEAAQDGILILDVKTGRIEDVNPFLISLLGFSYNEMVGKTVGELSPFKDVVTNQAMLERLQKNGYARYENLPLETKDGRNIAVEFVSNVYQVGAKEVIQCNIRDVTERKNIEQRLNLLETCISNLNEIVIVTGGASVDKPEPRIIFANKAFERLTGYTPSETTGRNPRFLQGKNTDKRVLAEIRHALIKQIPIRRQVINYKKDGTEYWVDIDITPIFNEANKCTNFAAIERDVTEDKKNSEQLAWQAAFFEAQVNSSPDGILVVDSNGQKILQNQRMIELWKIPGDFADEPDHNRRFKWITSQIKDPLPFTEKVAYLYAHPNAISGDELELINGRFLELYTAPVRGKDGKHYGRIWAYREITERKRSEARFRHW